MDVSLGFHSGRESHFASHLLPGHTSEMRASCPTWPMARALVGPTRPMRDAWRWRVLSERKTFEQPKMSEKILRRGKLGGDFRKFYRISGDFTNLAFLPWIPTNSPGPHQRVEWCQSPGTKFHQVTNWYTWILGKKTTPWRLTAKNQQFPWRWMVRSCSFHRWLVPVKPEKSSRVYWSSKAYCWWQPEVRRFQTTWDGGKNPA